MVNYWSINLQAAFLTVDFDFHIDYDPKYTRFYLY